MKKTFLFFVISLMVANVAFAGEMPAGWVPPKISAELERIKAFSGKWTGTSQDQGAEAKPVTVTYQVTSGGTAVVETLDPGTSHEMVSVYHDKAGKLSLNHYCMLGNEPELDLKNSSDTTIALDMSAESHAALAKEMHMHSLTVTLGANEITETWTAMSADGKSLPPCVFKLQKSA